MTVLIRTRSELAELRSHLDAPPALVATMGALHAGHESLIDAARRIAGSVLVSIFVNPMQFDRAPDLERYPRNLDADLARCEARGVDFVWAPEVAEVYPDGPVMVAVRGGELGTELEGAARPGHFDGMLTVVAKLFGLIRPAQAFFGEKDYQQLVLVRRMVRDLELGVDVHAVPTVRESDGLALSSRNVFLSGQQRRAATVLSAALQAGRRVSADGGSTAALQAAHAVLAQVPELKLDYLELRAPDLGPAPAAGPARLLVAGWLGPTRLIDNIEVLSGAGPDTDTGAPVAL